MNWSELFIAVVVTAGAYSAAEACGKARGKRARAFKIAGVVLSLIAGLSLVVASLQFGWVTNPPGMVAAAAAAVLLVQAAIAARDLSDGQPDRGCRLAVLSLPLLVVVGGAWLVDNVPQMARDGANQVSTEMDR